MLLGSYKVTLHLAPLVRLVSSTTTPGNAAGGSSFINPIVGLTYASRVGIFRWAAFAGGAVPIGSRRDEPSAGTADANKAGLQARSGMDKPCSPSTTSRESWVATRLCRPEADDPGGGHAV